jgi:phosphoglycolate phosphatase
MRHDIRFDDIGAMLFDFEGTLVDFQWKLSEAIEETLEILWNMGFTKDLILSRKYSTLMTEALQAATQIGLSPDRVREEIYRVYDRYDEDARTRWALRSRAKDFLDTLKTKGIRTGLVSNVGGKAIGQALLTLGLAHSFDVVISRNDVKNLKPDPEGLNRAIKKLATGRDSTMLVGDSLDDINAARNAGIRVMIITDGENVKEDILAARPDHVIQSYEELLKSDCSTKDA